jgi:hypothetical protein
MPFKHSVSYAFSAELEKYVYWSFSLEILLGDRPLNSLTLFTLFSTLICSVHGFVV